MGVRMGICVNNLKEYPRYECQMSYDSKFIESLEYITSTCFKCDNYKINNISYCSCFSSFVDENRYYILPKQVLLDNPNVINYEAMLELFEENNVDEIYLILN